MREAARAQRAVLYNLPRGPDQVIDTTVPKAPHIADAFCEHGGPCCGLTGIRCHIPGLPCGQCSDSQLASARAYGMVR